MVGARGPEVVGRDLDIHMIRDRFDDVRRGRGALVLIEGEAGSGKTTLLTEAISGAHGFEVFQGAGHEIDRDRPFGVIVDALGIGASSSDSDRRAIARSLRQRGRPKLADNLRYSLLEDILALVEREALARPIVLALDDLQWADEATLLVLHHLSRPMAHLPVFAIATFRPASRTASIEILETVIAGHPPERVSRLRLEPLDEDGVERLATQLLGATPGPGLRSLLGKAGGNPFFVTELIAALRDDRSIDIVGTAADIALVDARPDLRMVILRRLRGLDAQTMNVLRMAAVLGETFAVSDLAVSLDKPPVELVGSIDEAVAAHVVHTDGDRLAFRHDLVREALYRDIPLSMRKALHTQVARALDRAGASAVQTAPHFVLGATLGDEQVISCLRQAASDMTTIEPEAARRWLSNALELLQPGDARRDDIVVDLCAVLLRLGDAHAAETYAREALRRRQPEARRSALVRSLAAALDQQDRCLDAAVITEKESRSEAHDEIERTRLAAEATEYRGHVQRVSAEAEARDVLVRAQNVGDEVAIKCVLAALYHAAMWRGAFEEAVDLAEQIVAYGDDDEQYIITTSVVGGALARVGRTREAEALLRSDLGAFEARRDVRPMALVLTEIGILEAGDGRWDEAISDAEAALGVAAEFGQEVRYDEAANLLATLLIRRGETDRAAQLLDTLRSSRRFVAAIALARLAAAQGDPSRSLLLMREAWNLAEETGRISDLPRYGPDLVRLEMAIGEPIRAARAADLIAQQAVSTNVAPTRLAAAWCQALAASAADELVEVAVDAEAGGRSDDRASILEDAGATLAAAGRGAEAIAPLQDAMAYYERVGAVNDERRVQALLRALGVRQGKRGERSRPQSGYASLTETERQVVELAAEGLTNAEVGARLFISGRTVERHLTHVYSKLGVSSRVELATAVARRRAES